MTAFITLIHTPGNLMVIDGTTRECSNRDSPRWGVIGILDCGMVGRVDESLREDLELILIAAAEQDASTIADVVVRLGDIPADFDEQSLLDATQDFLVDYIGQSLDDFDISGCLNGIIQVVRDHHIMLPARLSMLLKVFVMLEGTSRQLDPKFSFAELIEPYARQAFKRRFSPKAVVRRMKSAYKDWDRLIEILPKDSADILHNLKRGKFDIHLEHRRLEPIVNRLVLGILTAALFMGSASLWSNQVPPLIFDASVPGMIGCLTATAMGWRIVRQISRQE